MRLATGKQKQGNSPVRGFKNLTQVAVSTVLSLVIAAGCGNRSDISNHVAAASSGSGNDRGKDAWDPKTGSDQASTSLPPSMRLLSGRELANTLKSLLNLEVKGDFRHADGGTGFETGSGLQLDANLFETIRI